MDHQVEKLLGFRLKLSGFGWNGRGHWSTSKLSVVESDIVSALILFYYAAPTDETSVPPYVSQSAAVSAPAR